MGRFEEHSGHRHLRLQELVLEELQALLRDDVADPSLDPVRFTALVLSVDYRHARVHFALAMTEEEARARLPSVTRALQRVSPFLRARLSDAIDLKRVPDLAFLFDAALPEGEGSP